MTTTNTATVATWRGVSAGWVAVGGSRGQADAERLLQLLDRVRPDYRNSIR
jgi:hypothetical protein